MLVSTDFHVPLFHHVYTGNQTDATAFQTVSEELAARYRQLAQGCEHITLIFDKGNNSAEAFETIDGSPSISSARWCPPSTRTCCASAGRLPALAGAQAGQLLGLSHHQAGLRPGAHDRYHL